MLKMVKFKLKEMIEKRGHGKASYRKLAREIGISHVTLWQMLREKYNPSLEMLDKLCKFFKCRPGDLLEQRKD
jgi:DNA-binding Xre family transcriptional regulator